MDNLLYKLDNVDDLIDAIDTQWKTRQEDRNDNFRRIQMMSNELKGLIAMTRANLKGSKE